MCEASSTGAEIRFADVPTLEGTADLLASGAWAGGSRRNLKSIEERVSSKVTEDELKILADAQTSGGILAVLPAEAVGGYAQDVPGAEVIGVVTESKEIVVVP